MQDVPSHLKEQFEGYFQLPASNGSVLANLSSDETQQQQQMPTTVNLSTIQPIQVILTLLLAATMQNREKHN